jgi:hypothetical protein
VHSERVHVVRNGHKVDFQGWPAIWSTRLAWETGQGGCYWYVAKNSFIKTYILFTLQRI